MPPERARRLRAQAHEAPMGPERSSIRAASARARALTRGPASRRSSRPRGACSGARRPPRLPRHRRGRSSRASTSGFTPDRVRGRPPARGAPRGRAPAPGGPGDATRRPPPSPPRRPAPPPAAHSAAAATAPRRTEPPHPARRRRAASRPSARVDRAHADLSHEYSLRSAAIEPSLHTRCRRRGHPPHQFGPSRPCPGPRNPTKCPRNRGRFTIRPAPRPARGPCGPSRARDHKHRDA